MKHHIKSSILKKLKRELWELRSSEINTKYCVDGINILDQNALLLSYGCIQLDRFGHIISSNESSYSIHYREKAEKDDKEYYKLSIHYKGFPSQFISISNQNLSLDKDETTGKLTLKWISNEEGKSCELIITPSVVRVKTSKKLTNARNFSLTRKKLCDK